MEDWTGEHWGDEEMEQLWTEENGAESEEDLEWAFLDAEMEEEDHEGTGQWETMEDAEHFMGDHKELGARLEGDWEDFEEKPHTRRFKKKNLNKGRFRK